MSTDQTGSETAVALLVLMVTVADVWAEWIGAEKICVTDIPDDRKYGMRFESPLVDPRGNAMLGMVSQLRGPVESFRVKYKMPKEFKEPRVVLGSVNGTRKLVELPFAYDEKTRELSVRMCGFRCWGNILALSDIGPFVSVEAADPKRDAYSLAWFRPGDEVAYKVRVFNPSPKALEAGEVKTHTVKENEDVVSIAIQYGVSPSAIMDLNDLKNGEGLTPGRVLKLPANAKVQ